MIVGIHVEGSGFVDENVLRRVDEGFSLHDPETGVTRNIGALAEDLAESINKLCAGGVSLASVEAVCTAICAFVATVEETAYVEGAVAQRDGKEIVSSRSAQEKRWNSMAIDGGDWEREEN